jgi:hypothetical protein
MKNPKAESNAVTALWRDFNKPNTGKLTPNNKPPAPAKPSAPEGEQIIIAMEMLGGNVLQGDSFIVQSINEDGTVTLSKQAVPETEVPQG